MVLLTIMPPWGRPTVPIGLGHLSQFLSDHGVDHRVIDFNLEVYLRVQDFLADFWRPQHGDDWVHPDKYPKTLEVLRPHLQWAAERLASADEGLIGFSVNQSNARCTVEVARQVKQLNPDKVLVFGGLGVYIPGERRQVPADVADLFVMGEGEVTLLRLVEKLRAGEPLAGTTGTLASPLETEYLPRPFVDLHQHPWPTYDKFKVSRYPGQGQPMPVGLGRGCICRCTFCGDYPFWGKFRSRRGQDLVDEVRHHVQAHGVQVFEFNDLAINGDAAALEAFCDGVIAEGLEIQWSSYAYLTDLSEQMADKLRRSGCVMLRFGMESASDSVLERMRKPHRSAVAARALARLCGAGIHCNIGLMVGFPRETDAELDQTIAFLQANQDSIHEVDSLSVFYIKPLSAVDRHPDRFGISFPEDNAVRWNRWEGDDGSTYEQRVARARRLMAAIQQTNIRFQQCNVFGM